MGLQYYFMYKRTGRNCTFMYLVTPEEQVDIAVFFLPVDGSTGLLSVPKYQLGGAVPVNGSGSLPCMYQRTRWGLFAYTVSGSTRLPSLPEARQRLLYVYCRWVPDSFLYQRTR
jgi:hypothetical protein